MYYISAVKVFYSDHFVLPLPDGHRFPMSKYSMLRERVAADGICGPGELRTPRAVTDGERICAGFAVPIRIGPTGSASATDLII